MSDTPPDLLDALDDGRQEAHDRARREDPGHDQSRCVCCCFDCDEGEPRQIAQDASGGGPSPITPADRVASAYGRVQTEDGPSVDGRDEITRRLAETIHERCLADWARRTADGAVAVTRHGVDAHRDLAAHLAPTVHVLAVRLAREAR